MPYLSKQLIDKTCVHNLHLRLLQQYVHCFATLEEATFLRERRKTVNITGAFGRQRSLSLCP